MASIQKITSRSTDPKTGASKQHTAYRVFIRRKGIPTISKTFRTKKLADAFATRIEGDREALIAHGNSASKSMTLGALIDEYMEQFHLKDRSGTSSRLNWWKREYGDLFLAEIDRRAIREALARLARGKAHRGDGKDKNGNPRVKATMRQRSGSTLNRYKASLSSVFEYGKEEHDLPVNPCREVKAKPESAGRVRFLSDTERKYLLQATRSSTWSRLHLLVSMALVTGARQGELLGLHWEDVDLKTRRALVRNTKNGSDRILPLTSTLVAELMKFRGIGLVFPAAKNPQKPFEFRKFWNEARDQAGLEDFRFHDLRHTAASLLAMNGATLLEIAEVLGHRDTVVTKRYAHLCADHKHRLVDRVMSGVLEG